MEPTRNKNGSGGFTLVEILVVIICVGILVTGLFRLLTTAHWSYTTQDKLTDMHMNGQYAIKKLSELLMEAGSYLPGYRKNVNVIVCNGVNDINILANPKGGVYIFPAKQTAATKVVVDSASLFQGTDTLLYVSPDTLISPLSLGFTPLLPCTLSLANAMDFVTGDALYPITTKRMRQNGTSLCVGTDTIADNIETLRMVFLDSLRSATTTWNTMKSCSLTVVSRTSVKVSNSSGDGYMRDTLRMVFSLKSKQL
jgi:type II secretory pathway pseudopilin PulG